MTAKRPEIHFHINPNHVGDWRERNRLAIFSRMAEFCEAHGLSYHARTRPWEETKPQQAEGDGDLHLVENGRMQGEGWLNVGLAYITGFWHLDPEGIQARSGARKAVFNPDLVEKAQAGAFLRRLQRQFVEPRKSRFFQQKEVATDLPQGAVSVFLQGRLAYQSGRCRVPMDEMISGVCRGGGGRPVLVKPHPHAREMADEAIEKARAAGAVFQVTTANVHDVLAASAVTVSVNSAVAMEGFLHRKPAILFGESDFESLVVRIRTTDEVPWALGMALETNLRWPFAKMLYWYYSNHSLELAAPDFDDRVFAAFERVGFPRERLGLG